MSAHRCGKYLPVLLCAASTCSASLARADEIAPPEKNQYASVKVPIIGAAAVDGPAIIAKLRAGEVTADAAWQSGELKLDDVLYLLGHYFDPWGGVEWQNVDAVRLSLAKLVVEHAPEKLNQPDELALRARLWLGDYLQKAGDERAIALLESVLSEFKEAKADQDPAVFQAAQRLGKYYSGKGEFEKAAQTWLRVVPLHDAKDWRVPDAIIEAARLYAQSGQDEKAQGLYTKALNSGDSWISGMVMIDQSRRSMSLDKVEEARAWLQKPLEGKRADEAKIFLFLESGKNYALAGEQDKAKDYLTKSLTIYQLLKDKNQLGVYAEKAAGEANALLSELEVWKKTPFYCNQEKITFAPDNSTKLLEKRLVISSGYEMPFTATSDDRRIQVSIDAVSVHAGFRFFSQLIVKLKPTDENFTSMISVSSPQIPGYQVKVPVQVQVAAVVKSSTSNLFFGYVPGGKVVEKTVTLSAQTPFRVVSADASDATVQVKVDSENASLEHQLKCVFSSADQDRIHNGHIKIVTDLPKQGVMLLSYFASTK